MKEREMASIIIQLNELLAKCNNLVCESGFMSESESKYGFFLMKIPSDKFESGFYYAVRYKDPETRKWLSTKTSTGTDNEEQARAFAIEKRENILQAYKERKGEKNKKSTGAEFYKMLTEYYQFDSKYIQDDIANGKADVNKRQRGICNGFIKNYLIPYLKDNDINSITEINRSTYSGFKTYLINQNKMSIKTINNGLNFFNRILQYHERNEIIEKLPYIKGMGKVKAANEEQAKIKKPALLEVNKLKNIFNKYIVIENDNDLLSFMLAILGLTTGMRDSEIARIKRSDISYIKDCDVFLLNVFNHKTQHFTDETDDIRKIPLHPFVVSVLKYYITQNKIGENDYIFGKPKTDERGNVDGILHHKKFKQAIIYFYKLMKVRLNYEKTGEVVSSFKINEKELLKEMREKNVIFYSFRHTFNTLCVLYRFKDTDVKRTDDIIDYFVGHKIQNKMRANYSHINKIDNKTFIKDYGKFVFDVINKYIFRSEDEQEKRDDYIKEQVRNKISVDEKITNKEAIDAGYFLNKVLPEVMKETFDKKDNVVNKENRDDIFKTA